MIRLEDIDAAAERYDLVVVGAGPAGLGAATQAAALGLSTLLVDENVALGGQIYRAITDARVKRRDILGEAYWEGLGLAQAFEASACDQLPQTVVWSVEPARDDAGRLAEPASFEVGLSGAGKARLVRADRLVLATGAIERPFPVPGWTLPGVMTAGAAQIAMKAAGLIPEGRTVVAGSGPLLLLLADQLKRAGADIVAVLDTTPAGNVRAALPYLPDFMRSTYAAYGLKLFAKARLSLPVRQGVSGLAIRGEARAESVSFTRRGRSETVACNQVLLHQGVIPGINMPNAFGCRQHWDDATHAWTPTVDDWFESTVPGIAVAGDGAGIAGATVAAVRGRIAAVAAAAAAGRIDAAARDRLGRPLKAEAARLIRGRRFIDALYRPSTEALRPGDPSTIVCRCEEVRAGQIRDVVRDLRVQGPNQLKAYLRAGMGPCQGRMCASSVSELIAEQRDVALPEVGHLRLRMPVKPITLEEIGSMPQSQAARDAVMR